METSTEPSPGLFSSLKGLLNTALAGVENRIELFLVELREERVRVFDVLLLGCAAAVLGFMALLTVTVTLVVIFWDSARVPVLVALSAGYSVGAIAVIWRLKVRLRKWSSFSATLDELKKDRACLEEKS
jgi:uncharacterized membrane protein YqjE